MVNTYFSVQEIKVEFLLFSIYVYKKKLQNTMQSLLKDLDDDRLILADPNPGFSRQAELILRVDGGSHGRGRERGLPPQVGKSWIN